MWRSINPDRKQEHSVPLGQKHSLVRHLAQGDPGSRLPCKTGRLLSAPRPQKKASCSFSPSPLPPPPTLVSPSSEHAGNSGRELTVSAQRERRVCLMNTACPGRVEAREAAAPRGNPPGHGGGLVWWSRPCRSKKLGLFLSFCG